MNDFDYDVLQKKRIARGVYHRKGTHGRKGITLRQDHMTTSQLKKENGPIMEYRLNEPMLWSEFRAMPEDLQQTYLNLLREKFNTSNHDLATMFGVGEKTFTALYPSGGYHRQNDDQKAAWAMFLGDIKAVNEPQNDEVKTENDGVENPVVLHLNRTFALPPRKPAESKSLRAELCGTPAELCESFARLLHLLDEEREYDVTVIVDAIYG